MKKLPSRLPRRQPGTRRAGGFLLFEVLVSILIFSFGILAIVGLMSVAVKQSSSAKYRADASLLANDLIGRMWVGDRSFANLQAQYVTGAPQYLAWLGNVQQQLPGGNANVAVATVAGGAAGANPSTTVTVTVSWQIPGENANQLQVVSQISQRNGL